MSIEKWPLSKIFAIGATIVMMLHMLTLGLLWQQKKRLASVEVPMEQLKRWISVSDFSSLQDYLALLNDKVLDQEERLQGIVEQLDKRMNVLQIAIDNVELRLKASPKLPNVPVIAKSSVLKKYAVQKGDTLSSIAHKHHIGVENLKKHNARIDPRKLQPGQILVLPLEP